jgi:hypothetical protein
MPFGAAGVIIRALLHRRDEGASSFARLSGWSRSSSHWTPCLTLSRRRRSGKHCRTSCWVLPEGALQAFLGTCAGLH